MTPVPTQEEMEKWFPDPAPERKRFHHVFNFQTRQRTSVELTLSEYRDRHVKKIIQANEQEVKDAEELAKEAVRVRREQALNELIDEKLKAR